MASKTITLLEDDLDGGEANETVAFSLDGATYEIDLSSRNASRLRDSLAPYIGSARRLGGRGRGRSASGSRSDSTRSSRRRGRGGGGNRSADIRAWAREQGLKVSERGRIPADLVSRYDQAH